MTALNSRPPDGTSTSAGREPPRWWTLIPPCLLTLPVAAWCVLLAALTGLLGCFDTCMPTDAMLNPIAGAEFLLAAATLAALIAGLARPAWRRALRRVLWIACGLACLGAGLVYAQASATP